MAAIVKTDYREAILDSLKPLEGKLSVQDLVNVVLPIEKGQRFIVYTIGVDEGEDVFEKPIIISITQEGKVKIEKNYTDIDLTRELKRRGVAPEDIVQ